MHIFEGEWVTILGANGSGKSTLARLMNGLYLPTEGKVLAFEKDTWQQQHLSEIRQRAGMVFQNPDHQTVALTVEDEVAFGPENLGLLETEVDRRTDWALSKLGLRSLKHHETTTLSPGLKQKLSIAAVLVMEPDVIIFDEATSMLDPQGAKNVLDIMSQLHRDGRTIIHITHEMEEIEEAQRVVVMREGRVMMDGNLREICADKAKLREAGLLLPFALRIRESLRGDGFALADDIVTVKQLTERIWTLLSDK